MFLGHLFEKLNYHSFAQNVSFMPLCEKLIPILALNKINVPLASLSLTIMA